MLKHFNEDTRVKFPATAHFLRLGYEYQSLKDEQPDFETKIFIKRFKKAIEKINKKEFSNMVKQLVKVIIDDMPFLLRRVAIPLFFG